MVQPQPQQQPGQPAAQASTVGPPPALGQPGTPGTGAPRRPPPQQPPQARAKAQPFQPVPGMLAAFPNDLVGFSHGIWFARVSAVGKSGVPLCPNRESRLPRSLRQHGYETEGYCLELCPRFRILELQGLGASEVWGVEIPSCA